MAFGLPVVSSRKGAAGETIRHGINGFLLDPDDLSGLAPLLTVLHRDRKALRRMSLAARATYISRPTWQERIVRIEGFMQKLTGFHDRGDLLDPAPRANVDALR